MPRTRGAREGVSILIVEQFAKAVLGVADLAAIMVQGRIAKVGTATELASELQAAYLGGAASGSSRTTPAQKQGSQ
jgi:ABC-type branched-subunit amino acid transport system ATPase component